MNRRRFLLNSAVAGGAFGVSPHLAMANPAAPFRTPYKYPKLVLSATGRKGDFDQRSIDDPIVFYANGAFQMLYIGWDGEGYQTGLATSADLIHWTRTALVAPRDPASRYTKYNLALSSVLRDKQLRSRGDATKVDGKYLGAWNAYPDAGYEEGAAVKAIRFSATVLAAVRPILQRTLLPKPARPWLTRATAALLPTPSWFRTAAILPCSISASPTNGRAAPARCWPSVLIHIPSSRDPH